MGWPRSPLCSPYYFWYITGNAAVRTLLRGAKRSKSQGIGYVTYEKQGSYRTALGEFYDLKPTAIQKKTIRRVNILKDILKDINI